MNRGHSFSKNWKGVCKLSQAAGLVCQHYAVKCLHPFAAFQLQLAWDNLTVSVASSKYCACLFFFCNSWSFISSSLLTFMSFGCTWVLYKDLWEQGYTIASVIRKNKQVVNLMKDFSGSWPGANYGNPTYTRAGCQMRCIIVYDSGKLSWRPDLPCKLSAGQALFHVLAFIMPFYFADDSI